SDASLPEQVLPVNQESPRLKARGVSNSHTYIVSAMQINAEGQITIPPDIREQLGLLSGTEIQLEVMGDTLVLRKKPPSERGSSLIQMMRGKATSNLGTDEILQLTRGDE
ncbi:AbrB/MazE/SpoVT family DNA-binding domain-containing protein, partial [Scytonema sp. HK-05]|uniref:AbrB/MazE/SpoVT family DNA-binding domain-containing protein n=1 Tax=Scytonema sp. HK-05 TaxID=1137095 RepID=UPI000A4FC67F